MFGLHSASTDNPSETTIFASDIANFQVHAIRDSTYSKNVKFKLSSSVTPFPIPLLTTSMFYDVYDDENWNLSVGLKPPRYPFSGISSGSADADYEVVFRGYNNKLGTINKSFELTASVDETVAKNFLRASKRVYVGATNENITGSSNSLRTDVMFTGTKYWTKFLDSYTLKQHSVDRENFGISGSYKNVDAITTPEDNQSSFNFNTLALNWYFGNVTGSDASGEFYVTDLSSGSAFIRDNFGWAGRIGGHAHTARGTGFSANDTDVVIKQIVNEFKFIDPEQVVASDMIQILSSDDELYGPFEQIPNYVFAVEKSLYRALSEEILDFFAGSIDFNNLIGDPVNRYRMEYKGLNHLRNIYFERVQDMATVEKFVDYFKWFDDSLATITSQLIPASAEFIDDVYNTVESHVLERNKYQSKFPTIEFKQKDPEASVRGIVEAKIRYEAELFGGIEASPRPTQLHVDFWKKRALPGAAGVADREITSSNSALDAIRRSIKELKWSNPVFSGSMPILTEVNGNKYIRNRLLESQKHGLVDFTGKEAINVQNDIKGGVNFTADKNIHYTYTSLHPAGPLFVSSSGLMVPQNVLFAQTEEFDNIETDEAFKQKDNANIDKNRKRYLKVIQGRDFVDGTEYTVNKNSIAFPFNVMSASIKGGVDDYIRARTDQNITITNLHNDAYGEFMEIPMQGPFTNYAVGGHQSRHIAINLSRSSNELYASGLDNYLTRPEAWKLLLGKRDPTDPSCGGTHTSGAIGMTGPDYPWPEANDVGILPYPLTGAQKAVYYRDHVAKRPVNIRNIQLKTGSTILGNYQKNYQVVHSVGAFENPRQFIENPPQLPPVIFQLRATSSTQTRTFLDTRRSDESHIELVPEYNINYISGTENRTIINSRFSAIGGILTDGNAYRNIRSNEYSVYNNPDYTNIMVTKPHQPSHGMIPEAIGAGTPGIRVFDIHGRDFGLTSHSARHTAKFGRDSSIFPVDGERVTYDLAKDFISYEEVKTYRGSNGIQGWWRLDASLASSDATDSSGRGRTGTFDASGDRPLFENFIGPSNFIQTGSAKFDGSDDGINIGTPALWNGIIGTAAGSTQKMTFTAWVYKAGAGGGSKGYILNFGNGDVLLHFDSSSRIQFQTFWNTNFSIRRTIASITQNQWHHIALTYDATSPVNIPLIYLNGALLETTETGTGPSGTRDPIADYNCYIGNRVTGDRAFEGNMADVAVWNRVLAAEEIGAIYNASKM